MVATVTTTYYIPRYTLYSAMSPTPNVCSGHVTPIQPLPPPIASRWGVSSTYPNGMRASPEIPVAILHKPVSRNN